VRTSAGTSRRRITSRFSRGNSRARSRSDTRATRISIPSSSGGARTSRTGATSSSTRRLSLPKTRTCWVRWICSGLLSVRWRALWSAIQARFAEMRYLVACHHEAEAELGIQPRSRSGEGLVCVMQRAGSEIRYHAAQPRGGRTLRGGLRGARSRPKASHRPLLVFRMGGRATPVVCRSGGGAFVEVMQAADLCDGDHPPFVAVLPAALLRAVHVERQMGAAAVVVAIVGFEHRVKLVPVAPSRTSCESSVQSVDA
jgi:hypothetical protein